MKHGVLLEERHDVLELVEGTPEVSHEGKASIPNNSGYMGVYSWS